MHEATTIPDGGVSLRFSLPEIAASATWPRFSANYAITLTDRLTLELLLTNTSGEHPLNLENCLHTYFHVGDITAVSIDGLKGATYIDKVEDFARKTETSEALRIQSETDRVYLNTPGPIHFDDRKLGRRVHIESTGAASTVIWNPWSARSQQMPDFGSEEYLQMLCVESGNVSANHIVLPPGKTTCLRVELSSESL